MTWNELNKATGDMLPDMCGQAWYELVDEGSDDETIWSCQTLDMTLETLQEITADSNCKEDYSALISKLRTVR